MKQPQRSKGHFERHVPQKNSKLPANFDTVVIELIKQNNKITREEIAAKYNVDTKTAESY